MVKSILVDSNIYIRMLQNGLDPVINLGSWAKENDLVTYGILRMKVLRGNKNQDVGLGVEKMFDLMIHIPTRNLLWENASSWPGNWIAKVLSSRPRIYSSPAAPARSVPPS